MYVLYRCQLFVLSTIPGFWPYWGRTAQLGWTELRLVDVKDSRVSVMYGRATRTSITKFPTKTWGAAHARTVDTRRSSPQLPRAPGNEAMWPYNSKRWQGCPSLPSESIVHRWESHCTMGQVGQSMGIHCPTWVHSIPLPPYHVGQVGMTMGIPCTTHILLYHVGQVGRPMEYHPYPQCCPRSYCPSYPTVPCRTGGTSNGIPPIPPVLPQILLSVLSYCTM